MDNASEKKEELDIFLKSRKRTATRENVKKLIKILSEKEAADRKSGKLNAGWMRSNELLGKMKIPASSFFHLISELEKIDILVKKEGERGPHDPGKKIVMYRIQTVFRDIDLMNHDEHLAKHKEDLSLIIKLFLQFQLLGSELEKCCKLLDIDYQEKMKEIGESALDIWDKNYKQTFGEWKN